jgi:glycosyltransferase involved in cell wall biosynthesis
LTESRRYALPNFSLNRLNEVLMLAQSQYVISAPYPEGAIVQLAAHLSSAQKLESVLIPSRRTSRMLSSAIARVPGERARQVASRLRRGVAEQSHEVMEILPSIELKRLLGRLPGASALLPGWEFDRLKALFDAEAAARISAMPANIVIGMPGASMTTFRALRSTTLKVLHQVDAPPHAHNRELLKHYPRHLVEAELVTPHAADRIVAEIESADVILSPSRVVTDQLSEVGHAFHTVQVPYGVDFSAFRPVKSTAERDGRLRAIYVGQISYRKGIPFLLETARQSNAQFELIGPLVNADLVRHLPENVTYRGVLPHGDLARALSRADVFVFPSIEDALALSVVEAAGAGLPVITTSAVGAAELLDSHDVTIVPPGDARAMTDVLANLGTLKDEARNHRAERIRSGDTRIKSWSHYAHSIVDHLDAIAART